MHEILNQKDVEKPIPELIQGGMGVGVSDWRLARSVAIAGEKFDRPVLGVVSGTGLPAIMVHRLQEDDQDTIRALNEFDPATAAEFIKEFPPIHNPEQIFKLPPKPEVLVTSKNPALEERMKRLAIASAFVEVFLAKEGHSSEIGINILEKVQLLHLPTLLGAMMAGVDTVLVGAGIPHQIPQVLKNFANNQEASYKLDLMGTGEKIDLRLDPRKYLSANARLKEPKFYAIVSHHALAMRLNKTVKVDGFVVEGPTAGGHNAPARGDSVDERGQPIYGEKDEPDFQKILELGKPYWLAGSQSGKLAQAKESGATGIQVGTVFALSNESGLKNKYKDSLLDEIREGTISIITSTNASPTGFPFQVVQEEGSLTDKQIYDNRERVCNLGGLVRFKLENGVPISICPAEPISTYIRKGGDSKDSEGVICLCNGLASAVGYAQVVEPPIFTLGKDVETVKHLSTRSSDGTYSAEDVVAHEFSIKE